MCTIFPLLEMKINLARCKTSKIEFVEAYTDWWRIPKLTCVFFQRKTKTYVPYFLFNPTRKVCSLLTRCISFISVKISGDASELFPLVFPDASWRFETYSGGLFCFISGYLVNITSICTWFSPTEIN